ncbi:biotin attachment protein [Lentisphaerota bacterium ZTH]|nr:biotin attachment protein [Lentisphaerota bacterium]WET05690.1 biotin attachment protein [Lentisphaerota bacterium ZTH]
MKKIRFMDTSFRDGFQSCLGARVKTKDFLPALEAAAAAGTDYFEIGGGARFQSLYFYCQEDAFDMMDSARKVVGPDVNLQTLARGANVVGLISQSRDIIDLHAKMFKKHGISTIRNFDALNDVRNLAYSGGCIHKAGLKHQVTVTLMGLPPGLKENYAHTPKFYIDRLKEILKEEIPFDSVCFKDASGTSTPKTVYETIKKARKVLPKGTQIQFHTHDTAGMGISCYMAAIEAGADVIDLAMSPVSGGTCQPDILTMWHRLKGTDYTLDIDHEKILTAESVFRDCLDKYFMPPEAKEVSPLITFSPMPGGALTANTQMMRDNNCLDLYPKVIEEMREVVAKGGFGTSVTPVSQFYFQQAFANTTQGKWKKITDGYGKMVLGYFGNTPAEPDPEVVKIASEQLGLEPTKEDVHDINDRNPELGIKAAEAKLKAAGIEISDENIFITSTCGEKGVEFLKGNKPLGIRLKEDVEKADAEKFAAKYGISTGAPAAASDDAPASYTVTVDGKAFNVHVAPGGATTATPVSAAPAAAAAPSGVAAYEVAAPMPGTVAKVLVQAGDVVAEGETVVILEAMKMETEVKTEKAGKVVDVPAAVGSSVASFEALVLIEEA